MILYNDVIEAPMVKRGIQVNINNKLTIIRLHMLVRNLVPALLGLKNEEGIFFSVLSLYNKRTNIITYLFVRVA